MQRSERCSLIGCLDGGPSHRTRWQSAKEKQRRKRLRRGSELREDLQGKSLLLGLDPVNGEIAVQGDVKSDITLPDAEVSAQAARSCVVGLFADAAHRRLDDSRC